MFFIVPPVSDPLVCYEFNTTENKYDYFYNIQHGPNLQYVADALKWVHLVCTILLFSAELIDSKFLLAHFTEMMRVITIPMYSYVILQV